jgi:hypothetical protein
VVTDLEVTFRGDAYAIVPGATYVLECDEHVTLQRLQQLRDELVARTDAKWVVLGPGMHVVPADSARADPLTGD